MTRSLREMAQQEFDITLTDAQDAQFATYHRLLDEWGQRMNLTTITDPDEVRIRHFLDSLSLVTVMGFDEGDKLIDVGTGAGFPGLALAIAFPQIEVTLLDSTRKKLDFLDAVIEEASVNNARTLHMRAEDAGQHPQHRAQYDVVTARAVALLPVLLEYTLPLAKRGGFVIALKGESAEREIEDSSYPLGVLRGEAKPAAPIKLPDTERTHYLVTIEKVGKTPGKFPRQAGLPKKNPIGS